MRVQGRLDLDGIDIEAAGDDHVLLAVDDEQVARLVQVAQVAGLPEAVVELGGGAFGVVVVAGNGAAPTQPDLAGGTGRDRVAGIVHDLQLDAGGGASGGGQAAGLDGGQVIGLGQGADRLGTFGGAVELEEDIAEALLGLLQLGRAHGRGAVVQGLQAGQVVLGGFRHFQQPAHQGRHHQRGGDALGLDVAAPGLEVGGVLGDGAAATEQRGQQREARAVADGGDMQVAGALVEGLALLAVGVHGITRRQPVVDAVAGAFAPARGTAGEAVDQHVLVHVGLDVRLVVAHPFEQVPEVSGIGMPRRGQVHAYHPGSALAQHVAVAVEQAGLDEDRLGLDELDLPAMLFEGVADIGVGDCRLALERGPGVQQREIVVLQDAQRRVAALQVQAAAHHVDDAVGQPMQLIEAVAPVALDVHQGFLVGVALCDLAHDAGEVHLHRGLRLLFCLVEIAF
ncbi:hypothetical protein D9M69_330700 [compost metagenome]